MSAKSFLLIALAIFGALFLAVWARAILKEKGSGAILPTWGQSAIGFVTNFFDTLGIGSFAPTTSIFKLRRIVPDEAIPGTLNVGHTAPVLVMAFIFVAGVETDSA